MAHVLAVADTDSYLKWSTSTLDGLPAGWSSRQVLLRNAVMPTAGQVGAAGHPAVEVLSLTRLRSRLRREQPDVLLLACTGPVVQTLTRLPLLRGGSRPVLLTGLPGISVPASAKAVRLRRGCDLFVVHSHRERREFVELAALHAPELGFGLARLPFLTRATAPGAAAPGAAGAAASTGPLVFAAQALVPPERADREAILRALARAAPAVVKLRAAAGEQQTHREVHPYDLLWADLVRRGEVDRGAVGFATGAMADALAGARGLVTVSSTAALEAVAQGLPIAVIDDFGVSAELINLVFEGAGCAASLAGLAGRLHHPHPDWLLDNYFHPEEDCDWLARLDGLVRLRAAGQLPHPRPSVALTPAGVLRQHLRLALSARDLARADRLLRVLGRASARPRALGRRARARLRGRLGSAAPAGRRTAPRVGRPPPPPAIPPPPSARGR